MLAVCNYLDGDGRCIPALLRSSVASLPAVLLENEDLAPYAAIIKHILPVVSLEVRVKSGYSTFQS